MIALVPEPDVAVTVTVLAPAGVPGFVTGGGVLLPLLPPPHAIIPIVGRVQSKTSISPRRRFLYRNGNKRNPAANVPPAQPDILSDACLLCALGAVAVIVNVVLTAAVPFGVTVAGEKLQVASLGRPEQAKLTAALNPLIGVTDRPIVPLWPGAILRLAALAANA